MEAIATSKKMQAILRKSKENASNLKNKRKRHIKKCRAISRAEARKYKEMQSNPKGNASRNAEQNWR